MTKEELIAYVKEIMPGKGYEGTLHDEVVSRAISSAMNTIFFEAFRNAPENLSQYEKLYEDIEVQDGYATLPVSSIQTRGRVNGVRVTVDSLGIDFVPTSGGQYRNINDSISGSIERPVAYIVRGDKVQFYNIPDDVEIVDMWIVRPFHEYDYDEEFPIPQGWDAKLMGMVVEMLKGNLVEDKSNDNNPNTM